MCGRRRRRCASRFPLEFVNRANFIILIHWIYRLYTDDKHARYSETVAFLNNPFRAAVCVMNIGIYYNIIVTALSKRIRIFMAAATCILSLMYCCGIHIIILLYPPDDDEICSVSSRTAAARRADGGPRQRSSNSAENAEKKIKINNIHYEHVESVVLYYRCLPLFIYPPWSE